jgi:hypothetical protein
MMQKKLAVRDIERIIAARIAIGAMPSEKTKDGIGYWAKIYRELLAMETHGTSDGKPWAEPPLTDEDAKQRPWVMVRDWKSEPWLGPKVLAYVEKDAIDSPEYLDTAGEWWCYARKANAEEITAHTQERTQ